MNLLLEWALTSSVLIVVVLALRVLLRGRVSLRLQYAMWGRRAGAAAVPIPAAAPSSGISV